MIPKQLQLLSKKAQVLHRPSDNKKKALKKAAFKMAEAIEELMKGKEDKAIKSLLTQISLEEEIC
jgi:hypothetical protein